jgi:hypothetical protein
MLLKFRNNDTSAPLHEQSLDRLVLAARNAQQALVICAGWRAER